MEMRGRIVKNIEVHANFIKEKSEDVRRRLQRATEHLSRMSNNPYASNSYNNSQQDVTPRQWERGRQGSLWRNYAKKHAVKWHLFLWVGLVRLLDVLWFKCWRRCWWSHSSTQLSSFASWPAFL